MGKLNERPKLMVGEAGLPDHLQGDKQMLLGPVNAFQLYFIIIEKESMNGTQTQYLLLCMPH